MVEASLLGKGLVPALATEDVCSVPDELASESVCIDFTTPEAFRSNYKVLAKKFKAVVVGTTGWYDIKDEVFEAFRACGTTLVAEEIFSKIQSGHGNHIDTFGDFELIRFAFSPSNKHAKVTCADLENNYGARVVVYEHNEATYMSKPNSVIHGGDVVFVCINRADLAEFAQYMKAGE